MKRILFVFICSFVCFIGYAQKKLFDNAIAAGRQPDQFYVLRNDKNKMLKLDDLNEYAQKEGYIIGNTTLKEISRFGDTDESVYTFEFLPQKEYTSYVFGNINSNNNIKLSELSSQGAAYCFMGWDNALVFKRLNNINWSGSVNNGLLEGFGMGYVEDNSHRIISVEGTFEKGFPTGTTKTIIYDMGGTYGPFNPKLMSVKSETVGRMSDGMAMIERNGVYGFVDNEGKIVIEPTFQKVLQDFADGQASVKKDNKEIIIDKKGLFIDYTQHQKELDTKEKEYYEWVKRTIIGTWEDTSSESKSTWIFNPNGTITDITIDNSVSFDGHPIKATCSSTLCTYTIEKNLIKTICLPRNDAKIKMELSDPNGLAPGRLKVYKEMEGRTIKANIDAMLSEWRRIISRNPEVNMRIVSFTENEIVLQYENDKGNIQTLHRVSQKEALEIAKILSSQTPSKPTSSKVSTSTKGNQWIVIRKDDTATVSYDSNITNLKSGEHIVWVKAEYYTSDWQNYFAQLVGINTPVAYTRTKAQFSADYNYVMVRQVLLYNKAGKQIYNLADDTSAGWGVVNAEDPVGMVGEYLGDKKRNSEIYGY